MTLSTFGKLIRRPALLASAALLLTAGAASAAHAGDAQAQAQASELLAGAAKRSALVATRVAVPAGASQLDRDPQEQARRLLLGTSLAASDTKGQPKLTSGIASIPGTAARGGRHAYPDAHALATQMITGKAG